MPDLDPFAAVAAVTARTTNTPGMCLNTVWQAYGSHPSTGTHAGQYPNAIDAWAYATRRHPGGTNPPAGYPAYFDALPHPRYPGDTTYPCGDVVISLGSGLVRCTDGAGPGRMGTMTIPARAAQIGRPYLGWTEDFLGYTITPTINPTPITPGEENMPSAVIIKNNDTIDKSLYLVPDDGDLIVLTSMDEVNALIMSGAVRPGPNGQPFITAPDGLLIQMRQQIAARKRQQRENGQQNA